LAIFFLSLYIIFHFKFFFKTLRKAGKIIKAERNRAKKNAILKFPIQGDYIFKILSCQKKNRAIKNNPKKICRDILFRI